ncbi:MAG: hypothetical protein OHK0022_14910 [Roseiflexaceae bacterium]
MWSKPYFRSIFWLALVALLLGENLHRAPTRQTAQAAEQMQDFTPVLIEEGGSSNRSLALADLNADGMLDIIFGNHVRESQVFLTNRNGKLQKPLTITGSGNRTNAIVAGDINNDGLIDVLLGGLRTQIDVYPGKGDGTFANKQTISETYSSNIMSMALGDLNGDKNLDLVVGNAFQQSDVLIGRGDGTFRSPVPLYEANNSTTSVGLGDFNQDGALDVILGNLSQPTQLFLGKGSGAFEDPRFITDRIFDTSSIVAKDINLDGKLDVVLGNQTQLSQVLYGNGNGTFAVPYALPASGLQTSSLAADDINLDGNIDIVLGNLSRISQVYFGKGNNLFGQPVYLSKSGGQTATVGIGDLNGDGTVEIILGNYQEASYIYTQTPKVSFDLPIDLQGSGRPTSSVAVGDLNNDRILDIVLGNRLQPSQIFTGMGDGRFMPAVDLTNTGRDTRDVDLADLNNDGYLDIFLTNWSTTNQVFLSDVNHNLASTYEIPLFYGNSISTVLGDVNNDGFIDAIVAAEGDIGLVYLNNGKGTFTHPSSAISNWGNRKIDLGDFDTDGILDVIAGNTEVHRGKGDGTFAALKQLVTPSPRFRETVATLLADVDSNGTLDVFLANISRFTDPLPSQIHLGSGDGSFGMPIDLFPEYSRETKDGALGDLNNDGRLDVVLVNRNTAGQLSFQTDKGFSTPIDLPNQPAPSTGVALGDLNGDGMLDIVVANADQPSQVILNRRPSTHWPARQSINIRVQRPGPTPDAGFFSTPVIQDQRVISIPYTLSSRASQQARRVLGFYSLDGGGSWKTAVPTNTQTTDLAVSPEGRQHVFRWDTFASDVFGQSDNVVVRLVVLPSIQNQAHQVAPSIVYASTVAATMPFRVRGTQVRVVHKGGWPAVGARVYRLDPDHNELASQFPIPIRGLPEKNTGTGGYLKGRSPLALGDHLMAIMPISATDTYTMYWTSSPITVEGPTMTPVRTTGVQTLTLLPDRPLILFNLDISLEWDARNDSEFQSLLKGYIQRASALLFRWSGGQAALGDIRIFNNHERWDTAHIRLYATNRMRPNAAQGGISSQIRIDPQHSRITYTPGQVRIGAVWNRYGDITAQLGDDWASTLAHELGHYALYLDDNYLGLDEQNRLISVADCPGPMTDPYLENYGSFHPSTGWLPACAQTLSHQETGRSDWATIKAFYQYPELYQQLPFLLNEPEHFNPAANPKALPVEFTRLWFNHEFAPNPAVLGSLIVKLIDAQNRSLLAGPGTTGFLFQDDRLIDLGAASLDQLTARGVAPNNRVCVFELEQRRLGCQRLTINFQQLKLIEHRDWQPDLVLTPVTSTTMRLDVTGLQPGLRLHARLYPSGGIGQSQVALTQLADTTSAGATATYTTKLGSPGTPVFEGYIHLFVEEAAPQRELVMDFRTSGNPGLRWSRHAPRGNPGLRWSRHAPVLSSDGQAILYGPDEDLQEGQFYMLQRTLNPPPPPAWAMPIGRAYRLTTTPGITITGRSLNIGYLATDVSMQQERGIQVLFWDAERSEWQTLPTRLDIDRNEASASISKPGIYMLMTSTLLPLNGPNWNLLDPYLGATQPITIATASITGKFSTIYAYNRGNQGNPWQLFDPAVPASWHPAVNDLDNLSYNQSYWIYATETVTWTVRHGRSSLSSHLTANRSPEDPSSDFRSRTTSAPPPPPATFYGFAPAAGLSVEAYINGQLCGTTISRWFGGPGSERPIFVIRIRATGDGPGTGCGSLGHNVTVAFKEGSRIVEQRSATWANTHALFLEPRQVYLPLISR